MEFFKKIDKVAAVKYILLIAVVAIIMGAVYITGTYAEHNTEGQGQDSARIACWAVDTSDESSGSGDVSGTINKKLNSQVGHVDYGFTAINNKNNKVTETRTKYSITVTLGEELPTGVQMSVLDPKATKGITKSGSGKEYTFECDDWYFEPAKADSRGLILRFNMDSTCTTSANIPNIQVSINYAQVTAPSS